VRVGLIAYLLHAGRDYRAAGVSTYIRELTDELSRVGSLHEFIIFTGPDAPDTRGMKRAVSPLPTQNPLVRIAWEQVALPVEALHHRLDLYHGLVNAVPLAAPVPRVVTVHDLAFLTHPERFHPAKARYLRLVVAASARAAGHLIAVSESTRRDLIEHLGVDETRVSVIYPGVHGRFRPLPQEEVTAFREGRFGGRPYLLHVGTLEPRKNIDILIRAFSHVRRDLGLPHVLAFLGARGWMYQPLFDLVDELALNDHVRFMDYVPPDDLPLWYNGADLFAFPSAYEGFGLPLIEAMACGVPTVTSASSSLQEVAGNASLIVEPGSVESLRSAIARVLESPELASGLRTRSLARAACFSWRRAALETVAVYDRVLERGHR
jgi:glycosyltransferase involved in cell wall biosynthesis